jgi:hypothetical protein
MNDVKVSINILTMVGRKVLCSLETGKMISVKVSQVCTIKNLKRKLIDGIFIPIMSMGPKNVVNI